MAEAEVEANRAARPRLNAIRFMGFLSRRSPGTLARRRWSSRRIYPKKGFRCNTLPYSPLALPWQFATPTECGGESPLGTEGRQIFGSLTVLEAVGLVSNPAKGVSAAKNPTGRIRRKEGGMASTFSRGELIKAAGTATAAGLLLPRHGRAEDAKRKAKKTLRIVQWSHFVPAYDKWFNNQYVKEWGEKNDTEVIVDNIGIPAINPTAAAEVSAKKGHDLFMFLWPKPVYEEEVIDHREIYEESQQKYGEPIDLAIKSTYNPKTKKYFGFSDMFVPDPVNWRKDLFDQVGASRPESWDDVY